MTGKATPDERAATAWTAVFLFAVVAAYYLLRPLREEIGTLFGTGRLIWLFVLTFAMIVAVNQPYMMLVNRLPVRRFLPYAMHVLALAFVGFAVVFAWVPLPAAATPAWDRPEWIVAALFFSWVTAFPVCGTALVWVHAVDVFSLAQAKRWFGLVAVGGTAGQIVGSLVDAWAAGGRFTRSQMAVAAAVLLELSLVAWWQARRAAARMHAGGATVAPAPPVADAGVWHGVAMIARSRYLQAVMGFVLLSSIAATSFYYLGNDIMQGLQRDDRRQFSATINLWSGVAALLLQLFVTGPTLLRIGIGVTLAAMAVYSLCGFGALALWPVPFVFACIETGRRTVQFAFDKPAREVLFTPLDREAKYKAKAFLDTTVLRAGDLLGAIVNHLAAGRSSLLLGLPATAVWLLLGWYLGRHCRNPPESGPAR